MHEVTGPIIAIVLTLTAVFVPIAFLGGLTGELYRQFAVTIAISVVISGPRRADADAGAVRADPASTTRRRRAASSRCSTAASRASPATTRTASTWMIRRGVARRCCCSSAWSRSPSCLWRVHAGQPRARRGPGLLHQRGDPARRRDARAHRQGGRAGRGGDPLESGQRRTSISFTGFDFLGGGFRNNAATIFVTQVPWDERHGHGARSWSASSSARPRASRKRWCSRSTRRRSSASAPPAASSSTSRTAATAAPSA